MSRAHAPRSLIVPTLCVVTPPRTLRVRSRMWRRASRAAYPRRALVVIHKSARRAKRGSKRKYLTECIPRGRRLAGDCVRSVADRSLQKKHRRQAASYQTTRNLLKGNVFLWEAACRRCSRRGVSGKSRNRSSPASRLPRSGVCCAMALRRRRGGASHSSPWSQQDSGITLSTGVGMIRVLEITLIVPTLRVGMPLRTLRVRSRMWRRCASKLQRYPRHAPGSLNPQSVPFVTRSVTGGIPTRSMGTISVEADLCITMSAEHRNDHGAYSANGSGMCVSWRCARRCSNSAGS